MYCGSPVKLSVSTWIRSAKVLSSRVIQVFVCVSVCGVKEPSGEIVVTVTIGVTVG